MAAPARSRGIFINCPFDEQFKPIFDAIVFTGLACGLEVRSALEIADSGELRLQKIVRLLESCKFSVHDLSRVELDNESGLPRFNMPIELGIALGMRHLGRKALRDHAMLVLDSERFRYQKFASDLAGVDISAHGNRPEKVVATTRDFLSTHLGPLPSGKVLVRLYEAFEARLPMIAAASRQSAEELTFVDRGRHIVAFLSQAEDAG